MEPSSRTPPLQQPPATGRNPLHAILDQRGLILGYINAMVRNFHAAEDIFQEALIIATRETFNDDAHARAWIRTTVRNLAMNEVRRRARHPVGLSDEAYALLEPEWRKCEDDGHHHGKRLQALRDCSAGLSDLARQLIDLRFGKGLDGAAIAARIGRPVNTVYVGLSRIYKRLAECVSRRLEATP